MTSGRAGGEVGYTAAQGASTGLYAQGVHSNPPTTPMGALSFFFTSDTNASASSALTYRMATRPQFLPTISRRPNARRTLTALSCEDGREQEPFRMDVEETRLVGQKYGSARPHLGSTRLEEGVK